jgi:hypothetical protein
MISSYAINQVEARWFGGSLGKKRSQMKDEKEQNKRKNTDCPKEHGPKCFSA